MKLPETAGMMSEFPHLGFSKRLKNGIMNCKFHNLEGMLLL